MKGDVEKSARWRQMLYGFEEKSWGSFVTCFHEVKQHAPKILRQHGIEGGAINDILANQKTQK